MKTKPFKHQKKIMPLIDLGNGYALFWDMGTGKTWIGCYRIEQVMNENESPNILIIALNAMKEVWQEEIEEHTNINPKKIRALMGSYDERVEALNDPRANIIVINFEGLLSIYKELLEFEWDLVIIDESQKIKNHKAKTTKIVCALDRKETIILTGTPILKNYLDIFSQYLAMDKGKTFGTNFFAFRHRFFEDVNVKMIYVYIYI